MQLLRRLALIPLVGLMAAIPPGARGANAQDTPRPELRQAPSALVAGEHAALAYSGFRTGQHPDRGEGSVNPSRAEIVEDLGLMIASGVRLVRVYDAGENSAEVIRVIAEEGLPLKVLLGCWLKAEVSNHLRCPWLNAPIPASTLDANRLENAAEVGRAIALARDHPGVVCALNVGNEALVEWNDHMVPLDRVIAYVRTVKAAIRQPVTVADNYAWWATGDGQRLARELDFLGVHSYPVWEGRAVDQGLASTVRDVERVRGAIPDRPIALLEAGWASEAAEFGARAGEAAQSRYVADLLEWARETNTTVFLFEAFDEPWKGDPANPAGAEKHWGLWNVDRSPTAAVEVLRRAAGRR